MMAALRTATMCSALLMLAMVPAQGQIAARSIYVADGSFNLPPAGPSSPRDPIAIAVAPDGAFENGAKTTLPLR